MNDVFRRYFRIVEGDFTNEVKRRIEIHVQARIEYGKILKSIGAGNLYQVSHDTSRLLSIRFDETPDRSIYKPVRGGSWYPKKTSAQGRKLVDRIEAVATISVNEALSMLGLEYVAMIRCNKIHFTDIEIHGGDVYIDMPWVELDPETDMGKEEAHLRFVVPQCFIELKGWEYQRAIDRANT